MYCWVVKKLVITGRYAHHSVINRADLVTEMCEVKHYYHRGYPHGPVSSGERW